MFARREVVAAIRDATRRSAATFGALSDAQLAVRVGDGSGADAWTAREVLAHLAGRALLYALLIELARTGLRLDDFDVDEFNALRVHDRRERGVADLLAEFRTTHEELARWVAVEPAFEQSVRLNGRAMPLSTVLLVEAALHSLEHAAAVRQAVGLGQHAR